MSKKIRSNDKGTGLIFLFAIVLSILYLVSKNVNAKAYIYTILFYVIFYSSIIIHHSHLIELRKDYLVVKNRFFPFIKPRTLKYEDLNVKLEHGKAFGTAQYISLINYAATIRMAFEGVDFDEIERAFNQYGVNCEKI